VTSVIQLTLTNEELEANELAIQTDQAMVFNPDFTLTYFETGFRIFGSEESLNEISAKRHTRRSAEHDHILLTSTDFTYRRV
jgi:hypothetical protein